MASIRFYTAQGQNPDVNITGYTATMKANKYDYGTIGSDKTITGAGNINWAGTTIIKIIYFNDTEIT